MKNLLSICLLSMILLTSSLPVKQNLSTRSDFCEGWEEGYCEGWKDIKGQLAICPVTPLCPLPSYDTNTYNGGYNAGFKEGSNDAEK